MKWAYQIKTNDKWITSEIHRVKTKKYAHERARNWAANGADTKVLKRNVRGWEIVEEWPGITEADVIAWLDPSNDLPPEEASVIAKQERLKLAALSSLRREQQRFKGVVE